MTESSQNNIRPINRQAALREIAKLERLVEQVARQAIEAAEKDGNTEKAARLQRILDGYLAEVADNEWPF